MERNMSYRTISGLALPVVMAQAVVLFNGVADLLFIAPCGTEAIAAVALANALCAVLLNFLEGLRLGTTVLVAKAADAAAASAIVAIGLLLALTVGGGIALVAPWLAAMAYATASSEALRLQGTDYLTVWLWALPLILCSYVLNGLFRGLRDTATPLYAGALCCTLNVLLAYGLVGGGFGFPALGVKGAAVATWLANLAGLLLLLCFALYKQDVRRCLALRQEIGQNVREYLQLAKNIGLNSGGTLLALLLFVQLLKPLGAQALAVHQIALQAFNVAYLPAVGFLVTASILAPQQAAGQRSGVVNRILRLSVGVSLLVSAVTYCLATAIGERFSPADAQVAQQAAAALRLVCVGQLFTAVYMVLRGALTGCGDSRFILREGLVTGYLLFLPLAYWLAVQCQFGVVGGYMAFVCWCFADCLALVARFYRGRKPAAIRESA